MTNAELIKALRYCRTSNCCQYCPSDRKDIAWTVDECIDKLHHDAADALEAADKRISELSLDCELFQQKCMEMEAQMPKEGEWIGVNPMVDTEQCSICGWNIPTDEFETNYCPNCGAKMNGERKGGERDGES